MVAGVGAILLAVLARFRWADRQDAFAYWQAGERLLAGLPLYEPSALANAPHVYWYPPSLAQILAPLTAVLPEVAFLVAWTAALLLCLLFLSGWRPLVALAMVAFLPVAVELWYRNVHLILAVLVVVALRRSVFAWLPAILIKLGPVVGLIYLLGARRYREFLAVAGVGLAVTGFSVALSPGPWSAFIEMVGSGWTTSAAGILPIPYPFRLAAGAALAFVGGRRGGWPGEVLLVTALVIANPTLWLTALSLFVALVPLYRTRGVHAGG